MNRSENFIPTNEELEKLAKVANAIEFHKCKESGIHFCFDEIQGLQVIWQPEKDRNQIAMIVNGITKKRFSTQLAKYFDLMIDEFKNKKDYFYCLELWLAYKVDPSISCKYLCEVIS